jgi:nitrogen-specific signal transduction histidine kinase
VESHGGSVEMETSPAGTAFTLVLPAAQAPPDSAAPEEGHAQADPAR